MANLRVAYLLCNLKKKSSFVALKIVATYRKMSQSSQNQPNQRILKYSSVPLITTYLFQNNEKLWTQLNYLYHILEATCKNILFNLASGIETE